MALDIWAFDLDTRRIESLTNGLQPKYSLHSIRDVNELPIEGGIAAIIVDTDFGSHFCEAIAEFAATESIPLFVWTNLGSAVSKVVAGSNIHLLPTPYSVEDVRQRLDEVLDPSNKKCLLAALADGILADSLAFPLQNRSWRMIYAATVNDVRNALLNDKIDAIVADLNFAETASEHDPFEPRPPLIVLAPFDFNTRSAIRIDNKTAILSDRLDPDVLVEIIDLIFEASTKTAMQELSHLKALRDADLNEKKALAFTDILIQVARDETQGRRNEEFNLLNFQTKGLVTELFDILGGLISKSEIIVRFSEAGPLSEEIFSLRKELARAQEAFEAMRSVEWFRRVGPTERLDLAKLIKRAASKVRANRRRKKIKWLFDLDNIGYITANPLELEECFTNIFTNSYEAIHSTGTIEVSSVFEDHRNIITIRDSGPGIAEEALPNVTKPYFTTKSASHAGLGLTISKGIIESIGGNLEVASPQGQGASIVLSIPAVADVPESIREDRNFDLLIVAQRRTLGFLEAGLVEYGHRIELADNINEAIKLIKKNRPKAILVLAGLSFFELENLKLIIEAKGDSKLIALDPTESLPTKIEGLDSLIQGTFPLHHLLAIINSYIKS